MLQLPQYRQNVQRFITQSCQGTIYTTILASTDELLDEFKLLASLGLLSTLQDVLQSRAGNIQRDVLRAIGSSLSNNSRRGSFARDIFDLSYIIFKVYRRPIP